MSLVKQSLGVGFYRYECIGTRTHHCHKYHYTTGANYHSCDLFNNLQTKFQLQNRAITPSVRRRLQSLIEMRIYTSNSELPIPSIAKIDVETTGGISYSLLA